MLDDNSTRMSQPHQPEPADQPTQLHQSGPAEQPTQLHQPNPAEQPTQLHQPDQSTRLAPKKPLPPKKKGFNKLLLLLIPVIFLLLAILGVVGYFVVSKYLSFDGIEEVNTEEVVQADYPITEAYDKLGDVNLSLRDIQQIEKNVIHNGNATDEDDLNRRLMALKHLYTNEFMRDTHTVQNLRNIYLLYSTDFSVSQQNIMKWFLELPPSQQEQWEYVHGGVQSFQDFRQRVEAEIAGHSR